MENVKSLESGKGLSQKPGQLVPEVGKEPMFYEILDGNNFNHRIANMNNPLICKRKGIIQVEAIRRGANKQANISFCNVYDPKLKIWYGVPIGIEAGTKKLLWKRFQLPEWREYNLANEEDALEWAILSRCEFMQGSLLKQGRVLFKKYDVENEAEKEVAQATLTEKAIGIVRNMKLKDWISVARYLGKAPEGLSEVKLQSEIYKVAKNNPAEIVDYWSNQNRELLDLFNAGKAVGILSFDLVNGWMHSKTLPIGRTEELVLSYLKKEPIFTKSLENAIKDKDKAVDMVKGLSPSEDNDLNTFEKQEDADIVELKMKAQHLGIKSFDVMSPEDLKKAVKEAEAEFAE
jgi:hypothetical protein